MVREFWQERGFLIKMEQPEVGVMETDWAENRAKLPQDGIRGLLGKLRSTASTRPASATSSARASERTPDGNGTEIYISHRGMEEVYTISQNRSEGQTGQTCWQPRPADPELEAEFLRRLMVRLGASEEQRARRPPPQAAVARTAPRSCKSSDGTEALQVNEPFDRAWRRVGLALDRVGFTVEDRDRQKGIYFVRYADPESEMAKKDNEKGLFSRLFGSSDPKVKPEQYRVQVKPEGRREHGVRPEQGRRHRDQPDRAAHPRAAPRTAEIALLRFASLASGSAGNCLVVEAGTEPRSPGCCSTAASTSPIPSGGSRAWASRRATSTACSSPTSTATMRTACSTSPPRTTSWSTSPTAPCSR